MPCPVTLVDYEPSTTHDINWYIRNIELHAPIHDITQSELDQMLKGIATEQQIAAYLASSPHFSVIPKRHGRRWISIPHTSHNEQDLYQPIETLLKDVLDHFNAYQPEKRLLHNVFATHAEIHKRRRVIRKWSSLTMKDVPALCSMSLDEEHLASWPGGNYFDFRPCITPIEIRLYGGSLRDAEEEAYLAQCSIYAEKVFNWQPGRRSVCIPLFTKTHVRLYHFDHVGLLRSAWININQHPEILVRIILFTLSQPAVALGSHPSFTWEGKEQHITVNGVKYGIKSCIYEIPKGESGPCKVWRVNDPEGNEKVIKWCWTIDHEDTSEANILQLLKGMEGVVQIIDHQEEFSMLSERKIAREKLTMGGDMLESIIVLESYGENIENFQSPQQFLLAFRDAIAGHRNMWNAGVLHRDISFRNILLGNRNAEKGFRGVVIDMDRAIIVPPGSSLPKANPNLGTRLFQSYNVTRSHMLHESRLTSHDYLDDLESFLWIFLWITLGWKCVPGEAPHPVANLPPLMEGLCSSDPSSVADIRRAALLNPHNVPLDPSYPPQFDILKTQLMMYFAQNVLHYPKTTKPVTREDLIAVAHQHYETVLGYIDQAISESESGVVRRARDVVFQMDEFSNAGDDSKDEEVNHPDNVSKGSSSETGDTTISSIIAYFSRHVKPISSSEAGNSPTRTATLESSNQTQIENVDALPTKGFGVRRSTRFKRDRHALDEEEDNQAEEFGVREKDKRNKRRRG